MKKLIVQKLHDTHIKSGILPAKRHQIEWDNWNYKSDVIANFDIAYDNDHIYLNFHVQESNTKAVYTKINDPVYEDSCVEFFISFDDINYYNLEFNCIGTVLGEYGSSKLSRKKIEEDLLKEIKTNPSLGRNKIEIINRKTEWTLNVVIPKKIFKYTEIDNFTEKKAKGNFYKCGDKQVVPHFLSWNQIPTNSPNFHLPEYFGELFFE